MEKSMIAVHAACALMRFSATTRGTGKPGEGS
jgi:hypothetical protein